MKKSLRVLVVEDSSHHVESAKRLLARKANMDFVGNYKDFLRKTWETSFPYDGVLSDVFFPADDKYHKGYNVPAGVGVFAICQKLNIPCVLVTAGHHHGKDYEWVSMTIGGLIGDDGIYPLVDVPRDGMIGTGELDGEKPEKGWIKGLEALSDIIRSQG